jgi:hypothetical protein
MKYFILLFFYCSCLLANDIKIKADCNASLYLEKLEEVYNSSPTVSIFLNQIQKNKKSILYPKTVSASQSFSLQSSIGLADPRVYLENDCVILTLTLLGKSVEYAIKKQKPDSSDRKGILLGHLGPFPRKESVQSIIESIHKINPSIGKANLRCTSCHVDVAHKDATNSYLGLKILDYKKEVLHAVVSPFFYQNADKPEGISYCASDLKLIQSCLCKRKTKKKSREIKNCDSFFSKSFDDKSFQINEQNLNTERCERIQSINTFLFHLNDKMNPFYKPEKCVFVK